MTIWRNDWAQLDTQHGSQMNTFISGKIVVCSATSIQGAAK